MHNKLYPLVIKAKRFVLATTFCILDTYPPKLLSKPLFYRIVDKMDLIEFRNQSKGSLTETISRHIST